jgi:hypothetical protein
MKTTSWAFVAVLFAVLTAGSLAFAHPKRFRLPSGSYQRTCSNIGFDGRVLTATCLNRNGRRVRTSIANPHRCRRDIANIDGTLMCQ